MRLVACALSTVLLSGCSWFGMGGGHGDSYGYNNQGYGGVVYGGNGCGQAYGGMQGGMQQYGQQAYTMPASGCAPGQGYGVSHSGSQHGMMYGRQGMGYGQGGAYGAGMGQGMTYGGTAGAGQMYAGGGSSYASRTYGGGSTTLSAQAPYGASVGGAYGGGTYGSVSTVQGAPIYVGRPYASYGGGYQAASYYGGGLRGSAGGAVCCHGGGSLPFGVEAGIGTDIGIGGDIFGGEVSKPFLGGPGSVSDLDPISYKDAFKNAVSFNAAATYDVTPQTTLIGQIGYSKAKGQRNKIGTVSDGGGTTEDLYAEFSDLEQIRLEGGLRRYMGHNSHGGGLRPYVGATAGFVQTKDVDLTQSSSTLVDPALFKQTYIDGGWHPTASGVVGAEWQVSPRSALGFETGIRWSDDYDTNLKSTDQWSIPLKVRGRVSF